MCGGGYFLFVRTEGEYASHKRRAIVWAMSEHWFCCCYWPRILSVQLNWALATISLLWFVKRSRLVKAATNSWRNVGGERAPKVVARGLFSRSFMVCSELCFLGQCMLLTCCLWADVQLCSGGSNEADSPSFAPLHYNAPPMFVYMPTCFCRHCWS
jgi:hypothetical protein